MSKEEEVCANCGIPALDDVKLKKCACKLVKYCSVECTEGHRERHDEDCKKRQKELHDDNLFRQPDGSHWGECPLCFLPLPLEGGKSGFWPCCSTWLCGGCIYASYKSNENSNCPFCREPMSKSQEENMKRVMKRVKANDPAAMRQMGGDRCKEGDIDKAIEYWTKAAELGDVLAHYMLGVMYGGGEGVEKDEEKEVYHLEKAAIGGHPSARHNLAAIEHENGNIERAVKHLVIAANLGEEISMKALWEFFKHGNITKEELEATLRTHKAAIDEMKSPERETAYKMRK